MSGTDLDIVSIVTNGGLQAVLALLLMFFINAYRNEVNDHKETLKEIAMVRQKTKDVEILAASYKQPTSTGI